MKQTIFSSIMLFQCLMIVGQARMPVRITSGTANDYDPCWSPSGDSIVFTSDQTGKQHIWYMPVNEGDAIQLTTGNAENIHPQWAPTGNRIAFSSDQTGNQELWIMELSGGPPVNITNNPASEESLDFSPDGSFFYFNSNRSAGNWDIWQQPVEGGTAVRLTMEPGNDGEPALSPDGSKIALISNRAGHMDIWVMNSDGSNPCPLTNDDALDIMPCWHPDGNRITFASDRNGNFDIFSVPAAGGALKQETSSPINEAYPDWSPDGQYLAFSADYEGNDDIWLLPALLEIPYRSQVVINGILGTDEWEGALPVKIYTPGRIIHALLLNDGEALLMAIDLQNTAPGVPVRFPEIMIDAHNDKTVDWQPDDWWFHVSATDCYFQGNHSNYSRCEEDHPDWDAVPNFSISPSAPPVDTIEIRIPFVTIGITGDDTIGICLDATNTSDAWEFWPLGASSDHPNTWGTLVFEHPATGYEFPVETGKGTGFRLYPNPAPGRVTVQLPEYLVRQIARPADQLTGEHELSETTGFTQGPVMLTVYNLFGETLMEKPLGLGSGSLDLDLSTWPSGLVIFRLVHQEEPVYTEKLIVY